MHGAGNDFVILHQPHTLTARQIAALCDRHRGIGCDQLITLEPAEDADVFMRIHNADGSEAGACGNATRCVAWLLDKPTAKIRTTAGILTTWREGNLFTVDMGEPHLSWHEIPLSEPADTLSLPIQGAPAAASMGNPHATLFVETLETAAIETLGPALEHHPLFPNRANVGFAQILATDAIRLRVWERGAGLTQACGSGACAALVNAHRRNLTARTARLILDGGELTITWREDTNHVLMTGPATLAFRGEVDPSTYPA
jgi:diaminopimelate epimerase